MGSSQSTAQFLQLAKIAKAIVRAQRNSAGKWAPNCTVDHAAPPTTAGAQSNCRHATPCLAQKWLVRRPPVHGRDAATTTNAARQNHDLCDTAMGSLTAHQAAAWLRDHAIVQEMHIKKLLQQEADSDVRDLLTKADLRNMTGDGLTAARIASAWAKRRNAGTPAPGTDTSGKRPPVEARVRCTNRDVCRGTRRMHVLRNCCAETALPMHCKRGSGKCGDERPLSNLAVTPFIDERGNEHDALEAWFQSRKTNAAHQRKNHCGGGCCSLGFEAKRAGREMKMAAS